MDVQVYSELEGDMLTVIIKGEIDHHRAPAIREAIDRDVFFYRTPKVVLDLSSIDFMDSSGLGLILGRYRKIKDMGSELILKDPTEEIMKIIKLSGVDKFIKIIKNGGKVMKVKGFKYVQRRDKNNEKKIIE